MAGSPERGGFEKAADFAGKASIAGGIVFLAFGIEALAVPLVAFGIADLAALKFFDDSKKG